MSLANDISDLMDESHQVTDPKYSPHTEFDGTTGFLQTGTVSYAESSIDMDSLLREFGYDPAFVQVVGPASISRWQQRTRNRETNEFETKWLCSYRFRLAPTNVVFSASDLEELIKRNKKTPPPECATDAPWFVFQSGDQQLGKRSSGGSTEQIIERYLESVDKAKLELKSLKRKGIGGVQLCFPGDCIEGNQSQSGRNLWLTQETITEQTRVFRRLLMHTIEEFAPLVSHVYVDVVNGNHDQAQRTQNTYPGDGWATECAVAVSDALKLNSTAYGHVDIRVPNKWQGHMTVPVGNSIVTVAHGHQWNQGKVMSWWSEQAINNQGPASSQILQFGHWHEWTLRSNEHRLAIGSSTSDCGSDWYKDKHGATAKRGSLIYLLNSGEISRMSLV